MFRISAWVVLKAVFFGLVGGFSFGGGFQNASYPLKKWVLP